MEYILSYKALHLVFVVTWFSGLFYIVRLFVYHAEALKKSPEEQKVLIPHLKSWEKKLWYGITWPSMVLNLIFGISMLVANPAYLSLGWIHVKLTLVLLLVGYHHICHAYFKKFQNDTAKYSSLRMRIWNEVATVFLVAIIFLAVKRDALDWIWAIVGLGVFSATLMMVVKLLKKRRDKPTNKTKEVS